MSDLLAQYITQRDAALTKLDLQWARERSAPGLSDEQILIGMHKARYESRGVAPHLRRESEHWLKERAYARMYCMPWPEDGALP